LPPVPLPLPELFEAEPEVAESLLASPDSSRAAAMLAAMLAAVASLPLRPVLAPPPSPPPPPRPVASPLLALELPPSPADTSVDAYPLPLLS